MFRSFDVFLFWRVEEALWWRIILYVGGFGFGVKI